jgi:sulfate adenylyltransferase
VIGTVIFFTGLSGSGKSTIAQMLQSLLEKEYSLPVTMLDGDVVRTFLSSELGFSKEHRDLNIRRIGWVASEVAKHGGVAICAAIAPYDNIRKEVRSLVEKNGSFVLVHIATPIEECEKRDVKGLYVKARAGVLKQFTGVSDPYELPNDAEITLDTTNLSVKDCAEIILTIVTKNAKIVSKL